jgi:hypothetical protein
MAGTTYDLAIWKPQRIEHFTAWRWILGAPVYYVEDLQEPWHTLTRELEASTLYFWSVRPRGGSLVGAWSSYDIDLILPGSQV